MSSTASTSAAMPAPISRSAILLDRRIGRSTPDSEALSSSDEEHDPGHMTASILSNYSTHSNPAPATSSSMHSSYSKPTRRPSWLSEIQPNHHRKPSNVAASLSQTGGIRPQTSSPAGTDNNAQSPSATTAVHTSFPFSIPLQPTLKQHRSASYSVGQREGAIPSEVNTFTSATGSTLLASAGSTTRSTRPSNISLTRRASRLPTLPDLTEDRRDSHNMDSSPYNGGSGDEEKTQLTPTSSTFPNLHNSKSNTTLRRQVTVANADRRHRAPLPGSGASGMNRLGQGNASNSSDLSDMDSFRMSHSSQGARRFSENAAPRFSSPNSSRDWPNFLSGENLCIIDDDTGRRHSLAESSFFQRERSNSIATATDEEAEFHPNSLSRSVTHEVPLQRRMPTLRVESDFDNYRDSDISPVSVNLGTGLANAIGPDGDDGEPMSPGAPLSAIQPFPRDPSNNNFHTAYFHGPGHYDRSRNVAQDNLHSNPYAVPTTIKSPAHILYIVIFKCSRADVFYVPENVGLDLAIGNCVIVDGDRGFDLGMVTHCNISLDEAKRLLKDAAIANYRWLTMFSEHERRRRDAQKTAGSTFPVPTYATLAEVRSGFPGAANSNNSPVGPQQSPPSPTNPSVVQRQNINPKPIRRKAEVHEIQVLKDKEAGEAKAKRVCQAKALELGLQMEILDAEFQIDFRRLTFYYFAQSYVNFNSLVGELFKIYKTRIWMSAVNPESFQQAPANPSFGLTPGAVRSRRPNTRQADILPAGLNGFPAAAPNASASSPAAAGLNSASLNLAGQNLHQFNNGIPPAMMHQNLGGFGYGGMPPSIPVAPHNFPLPMHRQGSNESAQNGAGSYAAYFSQPSVAPSTIQSNASNFPNHNPASVGSMSPYPVGYAAMPGNGYYGGYGPAQQNPRSSAFMNSPVHHGNGGYGAARQTSPTEQANGRILESLQGLTLGDSHG